MNPTQKQNESHLLIKMQYKQNQRGQHQHGTLLGGDKKQNATETMRDSKVINKKKIASNSWKVAKARVAAKLLSIMAFISVGRGKKLQSATLHWKLTVGQGPQVKHSMCVMRPSGLPS